MTEEELYKKASQKIRLKRIELDFSQEYMANQLNISQNAYSKNERNIKNVSIDRIIKISRLLECPLQEIFELGNLNKI